MSESNQLYNGIVFDQINNTYANTYQSLHVNETDADNYTGMPAEYQEPVDDFVIMWGDSLYPSGYSHTRIILTSFFVTAIMILIVVGNMLVCIAIATEKSLKTVQNWFIASLAVSDFLVGLIIMPFSLAKEVMGYWIFGRIWCEIHSALDVFLCTASINSLCLISLDRYWSVTHAVEYLKKRTPKRSIAMICFVWVISAIISLPPLVGWKKPDEPTSYPTCVLSDDVGYVLYSAFGSFYIPAFVMVFVYCRIFVAARSRARRHLKKKVTAAAISTTEYTNDPIKEKSTTTTTTTCTSFSNPSPTDRSIETFGFGQNEVAARLTDSNGTSRLLPSTPVSAPEIVIEPSPENNGGTRTSPKLDAAESCTSSVTFAMPEQADSRETGVYAQETAPASPETRTYPHLRSAEALEDTPMKPCLLKTPCFLKSPFGSTLSLAEMGRSDGGEGDSLDESRKRKKGKQKSKVKYQMEELPKKYPTIEAEKQKRRAAKARERRATLILGLIMASFILAWLPFFVLYVLVALCKRCDIGKTGFAIAFWLGYCNSALNPIIYTIFNRDFRKAFRKILFK